MKRHILLLLVGFMLMPAMMYGRNDWANYTRYAAANASVTKAPKAVLMGDSITDSWPKTDAEFFEQNNFLGRGISGQVTGQMLLRFRQDVVELGPKYVVILAGTNDVAENSGPIELEKVFGNIVAMCDIAKANRIKPIICSVLPAAGYRWNKNVTDAPEKIMRLNAMLKEYAESHRIRYVDYHSAMKDEANCLSSALSNDGVHPTKPGYDIMKELLLKAIK